MDKRREGLFLCFFLTVVIWLPVPAFAQNAGLRPVTVGQPMPEFTLATLQGGEITLSQLRGKNIMIIFLRGKFEPGDWCHLGYYQYVDLADIEAKEQIRKKHDVELLFVLSYDKEEVVQWFDEFPVKLSHIETWKNPPDADQLTGRRKAWMEKVRRMCPKRFVYEKGDVPTSIPILIDAGAEVSKGLGLFAPDWDGGQGPMNIPTVFLVDKKGTLQFKYVSQNTFDRPRFDYLMKV
ncbi:MAG: redoxin family protein, partial [Phycisphaerales bacterium]